MKTGDASRLFQHHPPLGRLSGDDRGDLALAHQRRRVRTGRRVGEDQRNILGPHIAAIDAIGRAGTAFDPADNLKVAVIVTAICQQDNFGEIARRALGGAGEDHVFHAATAHRFGRAFAHHPADRLEQVGLAAAVGADDPRQPRLDVELGRLDEAFEARQLKPLDPHRLAVSPFAARA